jgi:hypothetical protein
MPSSRLRMSSNSPAIPSPCQSRAAGVRTLGQGVRTWVAMPDSPQDVHELVAFDDPDERRTWVFDVTFLVSPWRCIYGHGCPGVLTEPAPELEQGCCSYGAHLVDDADEADVLAAARRLTDGQWQHRRLAWRRGGPIRRNQAGTSVTRMVGDACIFLNRPGFPAGAGCALHLLALRKGVHFMVTKPDVCWQLPLRQEHKEEDDGSITTTLSEFARSGWGPGGDEFAWWCTEAPEAFTGTEPVYRSLEVELRGMVGDVLYESIAAYLDRRMAAAAGSATNGTSAVLVPHPAVRKAR